MDWSIPQGWSRIRTIDAHAEGEPLRVILDGFPIPAGDTVLERRRDARTHFDGLRRALMWEPRGHADMYGCLVMPPVTEGADLSVLFLHNEGFSTMCGHGIIAVTTVLLEAGLRSWTGAQTLLTIDTPAGRVRATAWAEGDRVGHVTFENVPSFVVELDGEVEVPGLGRVRYDLAFGGAFYAFVDAGSVGLDLTPAHANDLIAAGRAITSAVSGERVIEHPDDPDLGFLYGTIFTAPAASARRHSRHVCIFGDGEVDRSPTGTGVSARLAILSARHELGADEAIEIESIIGSRFTGRIVRNTALGSMPAIVPEVGGRAFVTGRHEFLLDPRDPWLDGFLLR